MNRQLDSFSRYAAADLALFYTVGSGSPGIGVGLGRLAGNCLQGGVGGDGTLRTITRVLDSQARWFVHFAYMPVLNTTFTSAAKVLWRWQDGSGGDQVDLRINTSGQLVITRNGTTLGTSASSLTNLLYSSIELGVTFATGTGGAALLKVDGVTWLNLSSINTSATGAATADRYVIQMGQFNTDRLCDLIVNDGTTAVNAGMPGQARVDPFDPTSDATPNQMTPSTGSSHFGVVDESTQNGDTDYLSSSTVGDEELFGYSDSSATGTVISARAFAIARKDDAPTRKIAQECKSVSTTTVGPDKTLNTSYVGFDDIYELDPNTGAQWATVAAFNAAKWGFKVTV